MFQVQKAKIINQILKDGNNQEPIEIIIMASRVYEYYDKERDRVRNMVDFYNPIERKEKRVTAFKTLEDAMKKANELDVDFYSEHPYLLDRGITINRANKVFSVYTRHFKFQNFKTVKEAMDFREEILFDLIISKHRERVKR